MALTNLTCPECQATLKPKQPIPVGARLKCPKCGKLFTAAAPARAAVGAKKSPAPEPEEEDIPEVLPDEEPEEEPEEEERVTTKPRRKAVPRDEEDEDEPAPKKKKRDEDDEDDEPAPKKKKRDSGRKKKGGIPVWVWLVGAGVGVLLLAGVGVAVIFMMPGVTPGVTEANFNKLAQGMSEVEVKGILGLPAEERDLGQVMPGTVGKTSIWKTPTSGGPTVGLVQIVFYNGQIKSGNGTFNGRTTPIGKQPISTKPDNKPPDNKPKGPVVTQANFDRIQDGMTQAQVIAILGIPSQKLGPQDIIAGFRSDDTWKWTEGNASLTIHFRGGAYAGKEINHR